VTRLHYEVWTSTDGAERRYVLDESGRVVASARTPEQARLVGAAPALARALLALGHVGASGAWHTEECWAQVLTFPCLSTCRAANVALQAALGALP
jgi:hypothetical protein